MRQVICTACNATLEVTENSRFCRICGNALKKAELVATSPSNSNGQGGIEPQAEPAGTFQLPSFVLGPEAPGIASDNPTKAYTVEPAPEAVETLPRAILDYDFYSPQRDFSNEPTGKFGKAESAATPTVSDPVALEPLAAGLLLMGRYQVLEVLPGLSSQDCNWYRLEDKEYYSLCSYCKFTANQPDDTFCADCGTSLDQQKYFLGREVLSLGKPTGEAVLMTTNIPKSEGLINPYINFLEQDQAYSLKLENKDERPLTSYQTLPIELRLRWTSQLISLLVELHADKLVGINFKVEALKVLPGDRLLVTDVYNCHTALEPQEFQTDLAGLAGTLEYIINHAPDQEKNENPRQKKTETNWRQTFPLGDKLTDAKALQDLWQSIQVAPPLPPLKSLQSARGWNAGQIRTNNEDAVFSLDVALHSELGGEPAGLYIVADGMGGHENGEVASSMAIKIISEALTACLLASRPAEYDPELIELQRDNLAESISRAVDEANQQIFQNGQGKMGTTLTFALVQYSMAFIANVGDSRTYHWKNYQLNQVTTDDSKVFNLFQNGEISRDDIYKHPERNVLLRSLGEPKTRNINVTRQVMQPGDRLLLCSDGLWEMVHDRELGEIMNSGTNLEQISAKLVEAANHNGGEDNIGLVVVEAK